jgi:transposase InsO family protein
MTSTGLFCKTKRRFKVTTNSKYSNPISPNLLARQFIVLNPDKYWLIEYNYKRPHSSLGGLPPKIFLNQQNIANIEKNKNSNIIEKVVG